MDIIYALLKLILIYGLNAQIKISINPTSNKFYPNKPIFYYTKKYPTNNNLNINKNDSFTCFYLYIYQLITYNLFNILVIIFIFIYILILINKFNLNSFFIHFIIYMLKNS